MIFAAEWPFATRLVVRGRADRATRLRVGIARTFGTSWLGEVELGPGVAAPSALAIPAGAFGSGILEMHFECADAPGAGVVVDDVRLEDEGKYATP